MGDGHMMALSGGANNTTVNMDYSGSTDSLESSPLLSTAPFIR